MSLTEKACVSEFIQLVDTHDQDKCIEYINKHNLYNAIINKHIALNILQFVCMRNLSHVAMALIDRKCDLTHQNVSGFTAMMYASSYGSGNVVAYIIDKSTNIMTLNTLYGVSEMMFICNNEDVENVIKMIDRGYDIYYKNNNNESLLTSAIYHELDKVVMKLIDIDTNFIDEFKTLYNKPKLKKDAFYYKIIIYCIDKRDSYKKIIIDMMNDASPTNALYQSFRNTYAIQLVDVICDFIIL
ncbi:MAG: hypothetical protein Faunusvirus13_3 [Faunusvirus sp.]|jgi:ankyrin repeat protein|uniref:Uncharacterized protein n=1 Tax=Faunusvirus sp. TaxID=2487766 RepID=A0A3G4ZX35_9VIRU|nr:MAG: hypothetical protein Faunusvirus13_3 [Faunusvirus sp.]